MNRYVRKVSVCAVAGVALAALIGLVVSSPFKRSSGIVASAQATTSTQFVVMQIGESFYPSFFAVKDTINGEICIVTGTGGEAAAINCYSGR